MKNSICLVVDSSSSLPEEFVEEYGIGQVPFYYRFGNADYTRETAGEGTEAFYLHMEKDPYDLPHTAAPNTEDWQNELEKWYQKGARRFIVMTIASALSNSLMSATVAARDLEEEHPDVRVEVFDSLTCACGLESFEIAVAEMIEQGLPYETIVQRAKGMTKKGVVTSLFTVHDLTYMKAGGRIGGAVAFIGKLTAIKPVCEFIEGVVRPVMAVPGRQRSLKYMADTAIKRMNHAGEQIVSIQHALFAKDAEFLATYLNDKAGALIRKMYITNLGITVGTHSGPGAIGIGLATVPET